jgi:ArsR family transcriptional regulator, arsenate/arsenite/antimonite-responsive transcriptional repressor
MEGKIKLLKALGDETRIKILQFLLDGEVCACTLVPSLGKAQPTVSAHLKILENSGILESRREGKNIWYKIKSKDAKKIMALLDIPKLNINCKCESCCEGE